MVNQMTTNPARNERRQMVTQPQQSGDYRGLVSQFLNFLDLPNNRDFNDMQPKIEVSDNEKEITVMAELPGVAEEDIDVEISADGYLTISGEKHCEHEESQPGSYFSEISYGTVSRTIPLPVDLRLEQANAEYIDGVLQVIIPKSAEAQQKRKKIAVSHNENGSRRKSRKTKNQTRQ